MDNKREGEEKVLKEAINDYYDYGKQNLYLLTEELNSMHLQERRKPKVFLSF